MCRSQIRDPRQRYDLTPGLDTSRESRRSETEAEQRMLKLLWSRGPPSFGFCISIPRNWLLPACLAAAALLACFGARACFDRGLLEGGWAVVGLLS